MFSTKQICEYLMLLSEIVLCTSGQNLKVIADIIANFKEKLGV